MGTALRQDPSVRTLAAIDDSLQPRRGPDLPMSSKLTRSLLASSAAGLALSLLSLLPAQAHGGADHGVMGGALHPLLGLDHLMLLIGVGLGIAQLGRRVLVAALCGALVGSLFGGFGGSLPGAELLAALGVAALGAALFISLRSGQARSAVALTTAGAAGIHAMLHGLESSGTASWWLGALLGSAAVVTATAWIAQHLDRRQALGAAALLTCAGGLLAIAPL